jgi:predicted ester cyclase
MIAEENRVTIFLEVSGIHDGVFNGVPATGNTFTIAQVSMYEFSDGKVYRGLTRSLMDGLGLYQQMGVLSSTPEFIQAYNDSLK